MGDVRAGGALGADPSALEDVATRMRSLASVLEALPRRRADAVRAGWSGPDADRMIERVETASFRQRDLAEGLRRAARSLDSAAVGQRRASRVDPVPFVSVDDATRGGRLVQRIGGARAEVLVVLVPGVGTDRGDRERLARDAQRLWRRTTDRIDDPDLVAVVTWLGYDPPDVVLGALDVAPAREGARALRSWIGSERSDGARRVIVVGHSYGGLVAGRAAAAGAPVDVVVQLGSPGSGSPGALDAIEARGVEVRAVRAPGDPIGLVAGRLPGLYGEDAVGRVDGLASDARGHGGYLSDPVLLDSLAELAVGAASDPTGARASR